MEMKGHINRKKVAVNCHQLAIESAVIPKGKTRLDIKAREKVIKDFYAKWIAKHPSKSV